MKTHKLKWFNEDGDFKTFCGLNEASEELGDNLILKDKECTCKKCNEIYRKHTDIVESYYPELGYYKIRISDEEKENKQLQSQLKEAKQEAIDEGLAKTMWIGKHNNLKTKNENMKCLRPSVLKFAVAMEEKLKKNDYKGGWDRMSITTLKNRLKDEVEELTAAMFKSSDESVQDEATDVANFAMMIFDNIADREV